MSMISLILLSKIKLEKDKTTNCCLNLFGIFYRKNMVARQFKDLRLKNSMQIDMTLNSKL